MQKITWFFLIIYCITVFIYAARPLNTDDARVVSKNHCQLETWSEFHFNKSSEIWALPSCNIFWDTEITLGGMVGLESNSVQFQIKKLFVNADEKQWGIGIALGNIYNYLIGADSANDIYIYIPATITFFDSRIAFHFNVGYNLQSLSKGLYTLGIGTEIMLITQLYFIGEVYYSRFEPIMYQVGLRTWIIKDVLQIDSTYGNSFDGHNSFVSLGFRILPPRLF